jgi:hypothetical protein
MGAPLYDITIYYSGQALKNTCNGFDFIRAANFIADFYHDSLNGYKPLKTGRICIHLGPTKTWAKPFHFGAICTYASIINETIYLGLTKQEKYNYILNLLHSTIIEIADIYNWDKTIFEHSYKHIIESDFIFEKKYPSKKSKDRKTVAQLVLTKTEEKSIISASINIEGQTKKVILLDKRNRFCDDVIYSLAKGSKWFDNNLFGVCKGEKNCYLSIINDQVTNDLTFGESDF